MTTTQNPTAQNPTATLDLFREERTIELRGVNDRPGGNLVGVAHVSGLVGTIGAGSARYQTVLTLWRVTDERPAYRGNTIVTASDGSVWQFNLGCVIRNRQARIVGWADRIGATNSVDQARS